MQSVCNCKHFFFSFLCWFLHPNPRTAVKIFLLLVLFFHEVGMHCQCYGMNYLVVEIFSNQFNIYFPSQSLYDREYKIMENENQTGWKFKAKTIWITCSPTHIPVHLQFVSIIKKARKTKQNKKQNIICLSLNKQWTSIKAKFLFAQYFSPYSQRLSWRNTLHVNCLRIKVFFSISEVQYTRDCSV